MTRCGGNDDDETLNDLEINAVSPSAAAGAASQAKPRTRRASGSSPTVLASPMPSAGPRGRPDGNILNEYSGPFKRHWPWLVPGFVLANLVLFIITMYVNDCPRKSATGCVAKFLGRFSFQPLKENPLLGPSANTLEKMGALVVIKVVNGQAWPLISCIWLHGGVFHILANMLSLVFIGIRLEQEFGFFRIGVLYVISGFGGSLLSALFIEQGLSVGASGALFGLLGAMLSELFTNWTIYANKLTALCTLITIIILNLALGILPHVDNFAHIGGFLSGFLLGFVFLIRPQFGWISQKKSPPGYIINPVKSKHKMYQYVLWTISMVLLIVGFTLGLVMLLRGVNLNDCCPWCHYMSCVPTPWWDCKPKHVSCESSQMGNQLNMTCTSSGKINMLTLLDEQMPDLRQLCSQLCS